MFIPDVNAACINSSFSGARIHFMPRESVDPHESAKRLLAGAARATEHLPPSRRVASFGQITKALQITGARMTNWKARGVSKEGALAAEAKWGLSPTWVLDGDGPERSGPGVSAQDAPEVAPRSESEAIALEAMRKLMPDQVERIAYLAGLMANMGPTGWARIDEREHPQPNAPTAQPADALKKRAASRRG